MDQIQLRDKRSLTFSGVRVWRRVPATIKNAQSLILFKTQLKEYLLDKELLTQGGHTMEAFLNQWKLKK